jgi:uncharacterized cupin superfamily protein
VLRANLLGDECAYLETDPAGFCSGVARVGQAIGAGALAVNVFEMPPGQSICPYHYEYEEEWLAVLEGTLTLRTPRGEQELARGDVLCFPPGPDGAHKVTNRGVQTARVVMFSSAREPAVAVYPDSDKIGVWPGSPQDRVMLRRADGNVGYWDGET